MIEVLSNIWKDPYFYFLTILIVAVWGSWRYFAYRSLRTVHKEQIGKSENKVDVSDDQSARKFIRFTNTYNLVFTIQKRAFHSRTAAHFLFGFVIFLLFIGIISIIFGLPEIEIYDASKEIEVREKIIKETIKSDLGDEIRAMVEGRYWFKISKPLFNQNVPKSSSNTAKSTHAKPSNGNNKDSIATLHYDGTVVVSQDCGQSWEKTGVKLKEGERVVNSYFSADGTTGTIVGNEGSVFVTLDSGQSWGDFSETLNDREYVMDSSFSTNKNTGVIVGNEGSVFFTSDGGQSWEDSSVKLKDSGVVGIAQPAFNYYSGLGVTVHYYGGFLGDLVSREFIVDSSFSSDGKSGVIVGNKGSVFVTADGGQSWEDSSVNLKNGEFKVNSSFSSDGKSGAIVGRKGSLFVTRDRGQSWEDSSVNLNEDELVVNSSFSADGTTGVIVGDGGSVFVTSDGGQSWKYSSVNLKEDELVVNSSFSTDGTTGVIVGNGGSVFVTSNGGQSWKYSSINLKKDELVVDSSFSADGKTGVIVGRKGSLFFTRDSGQRWKYSSVNLKEDEFVRDSFFDSDKIAGIIVGGLGSVNVTWNRGLDWGFTDLSEMRIDSQQIEDFIFCNFREDSYAVVAFQGIENVFQLKKYKGFADWESLSILQLEKRIQNADEPIRSSNLSQRVLSRLQELRQITGDLKTDDSHSENDADKDRFDKSIAYFDSLTVNRIVTLTLLFFLARVLFQYAGYYLRLASFWDSRSDALLLAEDFAAEKSENFDDLVYALGPEFHKFASMPKK